MIAHDPSKHPGSIIRIHLDGTIPKDNPKFIDKKKWLPEIFQIGVRNPQGITLSPYDEKIYLTSYRVNLYISNSANFFFENYIFFNIFQVGKI